MAHCRGLLHCSCKLHCCVAVHQEIRGLSGPPGHHNPPRQIMVPNLCPAMVWLCVKMEPTNYSTQYTTSTSISTSPQSIYYSVIAWAIPSALLLPPGLRLGDGIATRQRVRELLSWRITQSNRRGFSKPRCSPVHPGGP